MKKIVSRRTPPPPPQKVEPPPYTPRIIIKDDGNWVFPETMNGNDQEVVDKTTRGVADPYAGDPNTPNYIDGAGCWI